MPTCSLLISARGQYALEDPYESFIWISYAKYQTSFSWRFNGITECGQSKSYFSIFFVGWPKLQGLQCKQMTTKWMASYSVNNLHEAAHENFVFINDSDLTQKKMVNVFEHFQGEKNFTNILKVHDTDTEIKHKCNIHLNKHFHTRKGSNKLGAWRR